MMREKSDSLKPLLKTLPVLAAFLLLPLISSSASPEDDADVQIFEIVKNPIVVKAGEKLFLLNCASCHSPTAPEGSPMNLHDSTWLHGSKPSEIMNTITKGVPEKGMPTFGTIFKPEQIKSLTAYVVSFRNSGTSSDSSTGTSPAQNP
jgi:mono/diheme cytochrome c family protein